MTWRERMALLLGAASPFTLTTPAVAALPSATLRSGNGADVPSAVQPLEFWSDPAHAGHLLQLAGHSSHRSHSSHSSHRSHVSGSGHASHYSGTISPAPIYTPPAPPAPAPPRPIYTPAPPARLYAPPPAGSAAPSATTTRTPVVTPSPARLSQDDIGKFVQRVQIALMVKGYDPGPADGELSPKTRDALKAFQTASGLEASGNMDVNTLNALGVLK